MIRSRRRLTGRIASLRCVEFGVQPVSPKAKDARNSRAAVCRHGRCDVPPGTATCRATGGSSVATGATLESSPGITKLGTIGSHREGRACDKSHTVARRRCVLLPVSIYVRQNGRLLPLLFRRCDRRPPPGGGNAATLDPAVVEHFARDVRTYIQGVAQDERVPIARIAIDALADYRAEGHLHRKAEAATDRRSYLP